MKARAEASERLSGEIIASMTSGLLVVSQDGVVRTLNPAGRRLLGLPRRDWMRDYREVLAGADAARRRHRRMPRRPRRPIVRRAVQMDRAGRRGARISASPSRPSATRPATRTAPSACSPI